LFAYLELPRVLAATYRPLLFPFGNKKEVIFVSFEEREMVVLKVHPGLARRSPVALAEADLPLITHSRPALQPIVIE
jgi:hypothetical protein